MIRLISILILFATAAVADPRPQRESYYSDLWCSVRNGQQEVVTSLGTRIDCLLDHYAVETDFDTKWAEGLGQALHYSAMTGKKAAVLLIIQNHDGSDRSQYVERLATTIDVLSLDVEIFFIETKNYPLRLTNN